MANDKTRRFLKVLGTLIDITQILYQTEYEKFMKFWEYKVGRIPGPLPHYLPKIDVWYDTFFWEFLFQFYL